MRGAERSHSGRLEISPAGIRYSMRFHSDTPPDLIASLSLETASPRGARHQVAQLDSPSSGLREELALLTSELVTRAVRQREALSKDAVELRVWMPEDRVRVELHAAPELKVLTPDPPEPDYDLMLLERIADRWSVESDDSEACLWFELDRRGEARRAA